jgi:predicted DNA-binding transcriptional regulator AlpA
VNLKIPRSLHDGSQIEDNVQRSETSESPTDRQLLVGAKELARIMDISTRTLWRLLSKGELIEPIRVGGNTRWRLEQIRRWIAEGCPAPAVRDE